MCKVERGNKNYNGIIDKSMSNDGVLIKELDKPSEDFCRGYEAAKRFKEKHPKAWEELGK